MAELDREFEAEMVEKAERTRLGMELKRRREPEYVAEWPFDDITSEVAMPESNHPQGLTDFFDRANGSDIHCCAEPLIEKAPVVLAFADTVDFDEDNTYSWTTYGAFSEAKKDNFLSMNLHSDTQ